MLIKCPCYELHRFIKKQTGCGMSIVEKLTQIQQIITQLKEQYHIKHEITLIAVSKQKPLSFIIEAIAAGHHVF